MNFFDFSILSPVFVCLGAFALDITFGDPEKVLHPVRVLGMVIDRAEQLVRSFVSGFGLYSMGAACTLILASLVYLVVHGLGSLPGILGFAFSLYFAYSGLALKCLLDEGRKVERAILSGDIEAARVSLAGLVSRDTTSMDFPDIRRSLAETMAENFSDGLLAPLFYLTIFGPGVQWVYKTVNTLDSMWGYRTERYRMLGWFPARLDDWLNWIPARLSAGLLCLASTHSFRATRELLPVIAREAATMESPNAGWPMAACAHLVGARMGGPTVYSGTVKQKPLLGPEGAWTDERLRFLLDLLTRTAWLGIGVLVILRILFSLP